MYDHEEAISRADPTGKQSSSESSMLERSSQGKRTFHLGGKKVSRSFTINVPENWYTYSWQETFTMAVE